MKNKDEWKIRRWLGDRYCLNVEMTFLEDKTKIESWKLFRVYPGWMKDNSDAIMTSETHTDKELLEFAKKHRKYDLSIVGSQAMSVIACLNLILVFFNALLFRKVFIRGFVYGVDFTILVVSIVKMIYLKKNDKVTKLEFKEQMDDLMKKGNIKDERKNDTGESN